MNLESEVPVQSELDLAKPEAPNFTPHFNETQREELLLRHWSQVHFIARRIHRRVPPQVPLEKLVNAGILGLMDAVKSFDLSRDIQFKHYAEFRIRGAILDSLREANWSPRSLGRQAQDLTEIISDCQARFGHNPTKLEIGAALKDGLGDLPHLLGELHGLDIGSLHGDSGEADSTQKALQRCADNGHDPYQQTLNFEVTHLITEAVAELPDTEREVMTLHHLDELTMKEVGVVLGIEEARVSQVHATALMHMRTQLYTQLRKKLA
jgi:RNA polymerase sigma factor for flagellar operon FliA